MKLILFFLFIHVLRHPESLAGFTAVIVSLLYELMPVIIIIGGLLLLIRSIFPPRYR